VSFAESDFSDLNEPETAAIDSAAEIAPSADSNEETIAKLSAELTADPDAVNVDAEVDAPTAEVEEAEKPAVAVKETAPAFIEPKPQQTGYVPVAPPSFSMPTPPSSGFDFNVRISPGGKPD
jgi:hypothetical protein